MMTNVRTLTDEILEAARDAATDYLAARTPGSGDEVDEDWLRAAFVTASTTRPWPIAAWLVFRDAVRERWHELVGGLPTTAGRQRTSTERMSPLDDPDHRDTIPMPFARAQRDPEPIDAVGAAWVHQISERRRLEETADLPLVSDDD